ncbi:ATP-binding protein [Streptomyces sp. NPDC051976]|uniref:AlbA family DNA-binding domain-containing protein n=1 Tax=Streptomyces sp. NPDC051976 TaxID=3154947 RepID=UPI00341BAC13
MVLPARLASALGQHPDDLTEDALQNAIDNQIPEAADLDWKKDFYGGSDAGKKELAKDVSAMANTVGGMIVIGVDDGKRDHAHELAPVDLVQGRGEEWIRSVLANWVQPVVPGVGVRMLKSQRHGDKIYWLLTVPSSPRAPHAVAAPGNDYSFRVHVRHGTTTRTLSESEIAQRYRDRFQAASDDVNRLHQVAEDGTGYLSSFLTRTVEDSTPALTYYPAWLTLSSVPAVRGHYPLTTQAQRAAGFDRFRALAAGAVTTSLMPQHPVLVGRRQVRFEGTSTGQLHQDGSFYGARPLNLRPDRRQGPDQLSQIGIELDLVALVQSAAHWAAETGATDDLMLSAALHRFDDNDDPVKLIVTDDVFQHGPVGRLSLAAAEITADLRALADDKHEAVIVAYSLASDLLADMGAHQPHVLTPDGDIQTNRLSSDWKRMLTGW